MDLFRSWGLDGGHGQREQQSVYPLSGFAECKAAETLNVIVNGWRPGGNAPEVGGCPVWGKRERIWAGSLAGWWCLGRPVQLRVKEGKRN